MSDRVKELLSKYEGSVDAGFTGPSGRTALDVTFPTYEQGRDFTVEAKEADTIRDSHFVRVNYPDGTSVFCIYY